MSFDLPRNTKGLRFTGSVDDRPPPVAALGRRRPTPKPGPAPRTQDIYRAEIIPTPYHGVAAVPEPISSRSSRAKSDISFDDDVPTMAMDREGLDILPGGMPTAMPPPMARMPAPPAALKVTQPAAPKPIPHFRSAVAAQPKVIVTPVARDRSQDPTQAPLLLWLMASLVAGVLSYRVLPEIIELLQNTSRFFH